MSQKSTKTYKYAKPLVSMESDFYVNIIIPFRQEYNLVLNLYENIVRFVKYPRYQITLVDDGSKNKTFLNAFEKIKSVSIIRNDKSIGFAASVNQAVEQSKTDFICVMHSDTVVVEQNYLWNLAKSLIDLKEQKVAFISSVTDNPMSKECAFLKKTSSTEDKPVIIGENEFLPFICTMFSKPVFDNIGGFYPFPNCWFEDKLLAKKINKTDYKMAYCPSSFVRHIGGSTIKSMISTDKSFVEKIKSNHAIYQSQLNSLDFFKNRKNILD